MWDLLDPRDADSRDRAVEHRQGEPIDPRNVFTQGMNLPRGAERERVPTRDRDVNLRGSEVRTLSAIGAFRVVPLSDLHDAEGKAPDLWRGDLDHLRQAGLIRVVAPQGDESRTPILTLTERGCELLERHRTVNRESSQTFYAGIVKPRELTHDARLYRAYLRSADRLVQRGARIHRVVLEEELKREYQRFLQARNRDRSDGDGRPDRTREEVAAWAAEHQLPLDHGRVQLPDVRIEYESPDGRREIDDIEVTTPHYRGAHAAAKARAGFTRYRARGGRIGGQSRRGGGRSSEVRLAEEFLA
jgi:DNA-binding MarR family transcriptional regulator